MARNPAFMSADTSLYPPSNMARLLLAAGCLVAAGLTTHLCFALARWAGAPPGAAFVVLALGFVWAPPAVFDFWDGEKRAASVATGVCYVMAVLAVGVLLLAGLLWLLPKSVLHPIEYGDFLASRGPLVVQVILTFIVAVLFYRKTLPAMLKGFNELGLMS